MKILITGASGLLGYDLWKTLKDEHELYASGRGDNPDFINTKQWINLDITNQQETFEKVTKLNCDLVIHSAAHSNVDDCQKNPELAFKINALGTRNICVACQRFDTTMCYISTDYVFDGKNTPEDGYTEFDKTNPLSIYAKSKYWGEFYVKHLLNKFYIARVAWLFGSGRNNNFVSYTLNSIKEKKEINVVKNNWGSPTYTKDAARAISSLIKKPLSNIYHITNSGKASRETITDTIFKYVGKSTKLNVFDPEQFCKAPRPMKSYLKGYNLHLEGFEPMRPWQEAVKEFIDSEF